MDRLECIAASFFSNGLTPICSTDRFGATNAAVHTSIGVTTDRTLHIDDDDP